jgi:flavin reductase (DIM6/NTAB) family NADH-FMN oxidoreductase RutF
MHLTAQDIKALDKITRLNIINSITGIKPANLIGTVSKNGLTNLAIFSSVVHLGSNPALLAFVVRPAGDVNRHTYENIKATGVYTINQVQHTWTEPAHWTSAKFEQHESEFTACGFTEDYLQNFAAPFVRESVLKIGMQFREEIPLTINNTTLIIGEVQHVVVPDEAIDAEGNINLTQLSTAGISGLNSYYRLEKIAHYPYVHPDDVRKMSTGQNQEAL